MEKQLEAVFEHGVLRPLEPLRLPENTHVRVSIAPVVTAKRHIPRQAELRWLEPHRIEFGAQWVALSGDELVSFGVNALAVHDEARRKGVSRPLLVDPPPN
jgi:predicted DNA-binding antitoxin AbrB/MazE fold protein